MLQRTTTEFTRYCVLCPGAIDENDCDMVLGCVRVVGIVCNLLSTLYIIVGRGGPAFVFVMGPYLGNVARYIWLDLFAIM